MDKDKLKLIIRNLEMLVDQLKTEVYSDVKSYSYDDIDPIELGYDNEYEGPMRLKRLIKLLERLLKKELYDEDKLKLIKEQLKTAKNELAIIEEKTSKGFK